ncbi:MAG TPA: SusC/RagA family TonB-linked outer membrane protein [Pelobium sp.]|nr:SusC/RagA family TonB-linked outer membrane protein [Pelobium sp.]
MEKKILNTNKKLMNYKKTIGYLLGGAFLICSFPADIHAHEKSIASSLLSSNAKWENYTGKVTDGKGEPLIGVTITVKGSKSGTVTDVNGNFSINVPAGTTLVFSYLGFVTNEVTVNANNRNIFVSLVEQANSLNEVVVVGYGEQKRSSLTGSVVSINAEEIEDLPVTNLGAALAGRLLGVGVSGGIARPGSTATLTIRNPTGIFAKDGGSQEPLYVIDGVIQLTGQGKPDATLFNNLDQSEVESISILKDAEAAIYGARGANGVVLVTTKKGKSGKPRISYNGSYAVNDEAYRTKMMSAYQFGLYMNVMNGPNGANADPNSSSYKDRVFGQDELDHFKTINYDWLEDAWSSSYNMRHALNVSGGSDQATYFAGISYNKQNGNLASLDFDRWNFRAGTDIKVASNLKVGLQVSGNNNDLIKTFNKVSGEDDEDDYQNLISAPRYVPMYIDGLPVKLPGRTNDLSAYHFYEIEKLGNLSDTKSNFYTVNVSAEYQVPFVEGLKVRAAYNRNMGNSANSQVGTRYTLYQFTGLGSNGHIYDGATQSTPLSVKNGGRIWHSNIKQASTQTNLFLDYNRTFGKHTISGLVSVERGEAESDQEDVYKEDPISSTNGQFGTAFGAIQGRTFRDESGTLGYIGRVNYDYDGKYLGQFLFRSDASTKFAPENYWAKFYSFSAGWVLSKEDFFKSNVIDFLKLRYSAGLLGNDQTKPWLWRQRYTFQEGKGAVFGGNGGSSIGMKMEASPNRNATWSDEFKNNLGIDARFLNQRLSATLEGYYNHATNILVNRTGNVPVTVGGSVAAENYGIANYFGYEIGLGWDGNVGSEFRYGINTRLNWSDNKIVRMDFNDNDILYPWKAHPGASSDFGAWGYDYLGMFKTQEEVTDYVQKYNITQVFGTKATDLRPGTFYYRDIRGPLQTDGTFAPADGIIDENDQIQLAKKAANHYGYGITLSAGYKGFNFNCVIAGSFGGYNEIGDRKKLNNDITRNFTSLPVIWGDVYDPVLNPAGTMPNPNFDGIYDRSSSFWEVSSFSMRMTSFNLSYSIPKKLINTLNISSAKIYFTGLNPFNLYNPYSYKDAYGAWDTFPNLKTYSFGLNLTL